MPGIWLIGLVFAIGGFSSQPPGRHRPGAADGPGRLGRQALRPGLIEGQGRARVVRLHDLQRRLPGDHAVARPDPEDARAGQALGKLGRVRLDHARPQARHARGPEPLCPALRRRPGQLAFPDRLRRQRSNRSSPPGACGPRSARPASSTIPHGSSCSIPGATSARSTTSSSSRPRPYSKTCAGCSPKSEDSDVPRRKRTLPTATAYCLLPQQNGLRALRMEVASG